MTGSPLPASPVPALRTRTVAVRLTDAEHADWLAASKAAGRGKLGSWARDIVAGVLAGRPPAPDPVRASAPDPEVQKLRGELSRIGNNLNQLVRLTNASGLDPALKAALLEQVVETRQVMGRLQNRLGFGS